MGYAEYTTFRPRSTGTNASIDPEYGYLKYSQIKEVCSHIVAAGRGSYIMKNDWEAAFRNIVIAPQDRWMMGFQWDGKFYKECCLPFGLRTAPFLFNLFAEALHWILESWLGWEYICHLLDDIIHVIPQAQYRQLRGKVQDFVYITNYLGIPRNDGKFALGQVVTVFGYELDTRSFTIRLPPEKVEKVQTAIDTVRAKKKVTLWDIQVIAGLLSWSAPAVQLGWVFCRRLWDFERRFSTHRPHQHIKISQEVYEDLHWWAELLPHSNGIHFFDDAARKTYYLYTDASGEGSALSD